MVNLATFCTRHRFATIITRPHSVRAWVLAACHAMPPFVRTSHSASCGTSGATAAAAPRAGKHPCVSCADRQQQADSGHSSAAVELVGGAALPCSRDSAGSAAVLQAGDTHHGSEGCWQLSHVHCDPGAAVVDMSVLAVSRQDTDTVEAAPQAASAALTFQSARPMS